mmetsp:Transcript_6716/g.10191  ORF Transcript_6716/g.10191 Transcript_6716/m.10191 type:complete len:206 (+) Transcript_6716:974-1591(+)
MQQLLRLARSHRWRAGALHDPSGGVDRHLRPVFLLDDMAGRGARLRRSLRPERARYRDRLGAPGAQRAVRYGGSLVHLRAAVQCPPDRHRLCRGRRGPGAGDRGAHRHQLCRTRHQRVARRRRHCGGPKPACQHDRDGQQHAARGPAGDSAVWWHRRRSAGWISVGVCDCRGLWAADNFHGLDGGHQGQPVCIQTPTRHKRGCIL